MNRSESRRIASANYYTKHPEKWRNRYSINRTHRQEYATERRIKLRKAALEAYGNICVCCGETHWEFLSIDHIEGNGNKHRREINYKRSEDMYLWLRRNNWPKGFRILFLNCNLSRGHLGYCPHGNISTDNGMEESCRQYV